MLDFIHGVALPLVNKIFYCEPGMNIQRYIDLNVSSLFIVEIDFRSHFTGIHLHSYIIISRHIAWYANNFYVIRPCGNKDCPA